MRSPVFVDTSGFIAVLWREDPWHHKAVELWRRARDERWVLLTTSLVVHECWAVLQARFGWEAVEGWREALLPMCEVIWVDEALFSRGSERAAAQRKRALSVTDCVSFEAMRLHACRAAIANGQHFLDAGFPVPE